MVNSQTIFGSPEDTVEENISATVAPAPIINLILEYEGTVIVTDTSKITNQSNVLLEPTLFKSFKIQKLARLKTLLETIVSGKPDEAQAILEKDPSLLYEKLEEKEFVTAPSGHKFNLKPYQAALSVDDTQMAEMIKSFFTKLQDEKEADKQFDEQCPKGWEEAEKKKWKHIFKQHDKLLHAIRNSKNEDVTSSGNPHYIITVKKESPVEQELLAFWGLLDATLDNVITAGEKPFNPDLLLKTLQTYDDNKLNPKYFGGRWDDPCALLYVQKVIGYEGTQRIMPVNYVQAFQDGLNNTAEKLQNRQPQGRSTQFEMYLSGTWARIAFYPLQQRSAPRSNFAVPRVGGSLAGLRARVEFSKLMSIKKSGLTELTPPRQDCRSVSTESCCEVM